MDELTSRYTTLKRESTKYHGGETCVEILRADDGLYRSIVNIFYSSSGLECYERIVKIK